jgi:hypothetical protein
MSGIHQGDGYQLRVEQQVIRGIAIRGVGTAVWPGSQIVIAGCGKFPEDMRVITPAEVIIYGKLGAPIGGKQFQEGIHPESRICRV